MVSQRANKSKENTEKLQTFDLHYFHSKDSFGNIGFQIIFAYQPTFSMVELKEDKCTKCVIG